MPWVAICQRARANCGRNSNKTYVNVPYSVRQLKVDAATFVAQNPTHPWSDPLYHEYIVDLTDQEADDIRELGTSGYFHDGRSNLPKWQNENEGSATNYAPGSFADPEDDQSVFTEEVELADDRWIIRLYDGDPGTTGVHVGSLDFDEGTGDLPQQTTHTIYMKLFDQDDVPSTTNIQNAKTEIAGKLMIFDFTNGVTTFSVDTMAVGEITFSSDTQYRAIHPGGEESIKYRIFGRVLKATDR